MTPKRPSAVRAVLAAALWCCLVSMLATVGIAAEGWKAGIGRAVITPDRPMWMSGYAARTKPAEGKLHELWAKALALEDARGRRAIVVTLDLCGIDRQFMIDVCEALAKRHQLDRSQIVLSVSHTHSGPVVEGNLAPMYFLDEAQRERVRDYTAKLREQVIDIANQAIANLKPAMLHYGQGQATFAVNRRNNPEGEVPQLRSEGKLRGPVDHDVPVLAVKTAAGEPLALLFGYACHATTLDGYQWSGDYPGNAQIELEKRHPTAMAMFVAGCGADQNPIPRRKVQLSELYGQQLAAAVDEVLGGPLVKIEGELSTTYREIDLPFDDLPSREQLERDLQATNKYIANRAKLLLEQIDSGKPLSRTYPYPVQTWRFGDAVQIVWLAGEVVVDYSLRLKDDMPQGKAWIAGYANDVMAYIPSRRVLQEGGYEGGGAMVYYGLPAAWSSDVEKLIVDEVQRQTAKAE
ncbi:MAG: neutral/alkaline non-lysosomal ceramidase N-terminal domain-containing protein [Pirellulales bacterium]